MAVSLNEIFMYTRIRILSLVVLFFITVQAGAQSTPRENVIISSQVHGFYEHLPADYNTSPTKRYPLIVEWHGVGEVGNGSMPALDMVTIHGLGRVAKWGILPDVTFNGQSYSFIVLNPQFINSIAVSILDIDAFLEYAFAHYRVDRNRVYMTGFSLGAMLTTSTLAQATHLRKNSQLLFRSHLVLMEILEWRALLPSTMWPSMDFTVILTLTVPPNLRWIGILLLIPQQWSASHSFCSFFARNSPAGCYSA
jgi:predicted alpha/beta-fold hydrolase